MWREIWRKKWRGVERKMLKNIRFWCQTILQIDYFNYERDKLGQSKVEEKWKKEEGNFEYVNERWR